MITMREKYSKSEKKILRRLYELHYSITNTVDVPAGMGLLRQDTNLDKHSIRRACINLQSKGLVRIIDMDKENLFCKITPKAIRKIEEE